MSSFSRISRTSKLIYLSRISISSSLWRSRSFANTAMASALPIIACGKSPQIAAGVKKGLLPDYEVIHVIFSPAHGVSDIPALLQGKTPPSVPGEEQVGSGNYSKPPVAIITGGGYDDAAFEQMYDAAKERRREVLWLRPDMTVETPPLGPKYGEHMVERVRAALKRLQNEGKLGGERKEGADEVVFY